MNEKRKKIREIQKSRLLVMILLMTAFLYPNRVAASVFSETMTASEETLGENEELSAENAPEKGELLVDDADLLTDQEERELLGKLTEVSETHQCDVVVYTTNDSVSSFPEIDAADYYDSHGYGYGEDATGIILLVSMRDRDWATATTGEASAIFTDAGLEYISDLFLEELSDGNYLESFMIFAEQCEDFLIQAENGEPYDVGNMPKGPFEAGETFLTALFFGIIFATAISLFLKRGLKSVRMNYSAKNYLRPGSFHLNRKQDMFLYERQTKKYTPSSSGSSGGGRGGSRTFSGSSGRSHGGRSGKF